MTPQEIKILHREADRHANSLVFMTPFATYSE